LQFQSSKTNRCYRRTCHCHQMMILAIKYPLHFQVEVYSFIGRRE
jgi:hypothetical protein